MARSLHILHSYTTTVNCLEGQNNSWPKPSRQKEQRKKNRKWKKRKNREKFLAWRLYFSEKAKKNNFWTICELHL